MSQQLLTAKQVAQQLAVSSATVLHLCKAGKLASVRVGCRYRITQEAVTAYLESAATVPEVELQAPRKPRQVNGQRLNHLTQLEKYQQHYAKHPLN